MKALVVVSELNSARTLRRCLDSLLDQDSKDDYRIIIVDGGSTDGSIEITKSFAPRLNVIISPGMSEVGGQNFACFLALESEYDVILFTNSDCYVGRNWVSRHLAWHEHGYDMVGGKVFWGGDEYGFSWSYMTPPAPTNLLTSGLSLGFSNCSVSIALFKKVGPLKEMKAHQDMDFWIRAIKMGARMALDPDIEIYHDHPMRSIKGSWLRSFYYGRNHVILLRSGFGRTKWPYYASWPYSLNTLQDFTMVRGTRIWKQQRATAEKFRIRPGLLRFLFLKFFAFKTANVFGWIMGMLYPVGKVAGTEISDAHIWGRSDG